LGHMLPAWIWKASSWWRVEHWGLHSWWLASAQFSFLWEGGGVWGCGRGGGICKYSLHDITADVLKHKVSGTGTKQL
jgi:hypothetical protein